MGGILRFIIVMILIAGCTAQTLNLGEEDNGRQLDLKAGDSIAVSLDSNPTTGYSWKITQMDPAIIVNESYTYRGPHLEEKDVVGAGGEEVFTFRTVGKGETALVLEYMRPWENESIDTFQLDIAVR